MIMKRKDSPLENIEPMMAAMFDEFKIVPKFTYKHIDLMFENVAHFGTLLRLSTDSIKNFQLPFQVVITEDLARNGYFAEIFWASVSRWEMEAAPYVYPEKRIWKSCFERCMVYDDALSGVYFDRGLKGVLAKVQDHVNATLLVGGYLDPVGPTIPIAFQFHGYYYGKNVSELKKE